MKVHTLRYSCILNADIERVFAFHTDTRNLPLITPPWVGVDIIKMELPLREKSTVVLDIKRFGITTRWVMEIAVLESPSIITDVMIEGPFAQFIHERHFVSLENNETLMRENISVSLPLGWLGDLFYSWIKKDMDKMFEFRHIATQRYFLKNSTLPYFTKSSYPNAMIRP
ncbi:MAG: SRPBCC family protein [Sulfuricurvum sp.]|nr:SRPBCC family protein [Sulfuricurvum sp.]